MPDTSCLIIDDVSPAIAAMTELGRNVASDSTNTIRQVVLSFARRRGWRVVSHDAFAAWIRESVLTGVNVVLDPLLPVASVPDAHSCRMTRVAGQQLRWLGPFLEREGIHRYSSLVRLIDDAASSGQTLCQVAQAITVCEARVQEIVVCASSQRSRDGVAARQPGARWRDYVPGDFRVIHLRDGCPFLPYSARATGQTVSLEASGPDIELRVPTSTVPGNLWQVLCMDRGIAEEIAVGRAAIAARLSSELQRDACVRDLPLLGPGMSAVAYRGGPVSADTSLALL